MWCWQASIARLQWAQLTPRHPQLCYLPSSWPELFASVLSAPAEPHVSSFRDTEGPGWRAEQTLGRHVTAKLSMFRVTWQWQWRDRDCSGHKERNLMYFMTTGRTSILLLCLLHISSTGTGYCDIEFWRENTEARTHDRWHPGPLSHRAMPWTSWHWLGID